MTNQALNRCTTCQRIWPRSGRATTCPHCGAADTIESYYEPDQATTPVPPRPSRSSRAFDERDEDLRFRNEVSSQTWIAWLALVAGLCLVGLMMLGGMVFWITLRAAPNPPLPPGLPPPQVAVQHQNNAPDLPAPDKLLAPDAQPDRRIDWERLPAPDVERQPGGRADLVDD